MKISKVLLVGMLASMVMSIYGRELTDIEKRKYKTSHKFEEILLNPSGVSARGTSYQLFQVVYLKKNIIDENKNGDLVSARNYEGIDVEGGGTVPIFYKTTETHITRLIETLKPNTVLSLYASLKHKKDKKSKEDVYFFIIDDIEIFDVLNEDITNFIHTDYKVAKVRAIELFLTNYIDVKVKLPVHFSSIGNIGGQYFTLANMSMEGYCSLKTSEKFFLDMIMNRNNKFCTDVLLDVSEETLLYFCGKLTKLVSTTKKNSRPSFYFHIDGIVPVPKGEQPLAEAPITTKIIPQSIPVAPQPVASPPPVVSPQPVTTPQPVVIEPVEKVTTTPPKPVEKPKPATDKDISNILDAL